MIPPNIHMLNSSLLALPVAALVTRRLLLNYKSPALVGAGTAGEKPKTGVNRPHTFAERLKNIRGYSHFGLNE
jgi:hypothetical protein